MKLQSAIVPPVDETQLIAPPLGTEESLAELFMKLQERIVVLWAETNSTAPPYVPAMESWNVQFISWKLLVPWAYMHPPFPVLYPFLNMMFFNTTLLPVMSKIPL